MTTSSVPDYLSIDDLRRALKIRDLTDPAHGVHAIQILVSDVVKALTAMWSFDRIIRLSSIPLRSMRAPAADHSRPAGTAPAARPTRSEARVPLLALIGYGIGGLLAVAVHPQALGPGTAGYVAGS